MCGSGRGAGGPSPPLENHISNTGPDPLNIVKLPNQLSILGHNHHGSKAPFKWRFAGGRKIAR